MAKQLVWAWPAVLISLVACSGERSVTTFSPANATLQLILDQGPRTLQHLEAGDAVRLSVQTVGSAEAPFRAELSLNETRLRIEKVPTGERKLVVMEWLDSQRNPLGQVRLSNVLSIHGGVNNVRLNDVTTATAEVYEALKKNNAPDADTFELVTLRYVVEDATRKLGLITPRQIVAERVAAAITGKSSKDLPAPGSDWATGVATVTVSFDDYPTGMLTRLTLDDGASRSVYTRTGEPVQFYPVLPDAKGRSLTVTPLDAGTDWGETKTSIPVSAGQTAVHRVPSAVKSQPGIRLPIRLGLGAGLQASDGLWVIGGVTLPSEAVNAAPTVSRVTRAKDVYRFNRESAWKAVLSLPESFPLYGAGMTLSGDRIFYFGGFLNQLPYRQWGFIDAREGGTVVVKGPLPANFEFTNGICGRVGSRVFLTSTTNSGESVMARFNTESETFEGDIGTGPVFPVTAAATGVIGDKIYAAGGYVSPLEPIGKVQVLDPASGGWQVVASMPTPRYGAAAVVVDGKLWVIGGEESRGVASRAVEVYDPVNDSWMRRAPLRVARSYPAAGVVKADNANRIVVAGGVMGDSPDGFPLAIDDVEELTP